MQWWLTDRMMCFHAPNQDSYAQRDDIGFGARCVSKGGQKCGNSVSGCRGGWFFNRGGDSRVEWRFHCYAETGNVNRIRHNYHHEGLRQRNWRFVWWGVRILAFKRGWRGGNRQQDVWDRRRVEQCQNCCRERLSGIYHPLAVWQGVSSSVCVYELRRRRLNHIRRGPFVRYLSSVWRLIHQRILDWRICNVRHSFGMDENVLLS